MKAKFYHTKVHFSGYNTPHFTTTRTQAISDPVITSKGLINYLITVIKLEILSGILSACCLVVVMQASSDRVNRLCSLDAAYPLCTLYTTEVVGTWAEAP